MTMSSASLNRLLAVLLAAAAATGLLTIRAGAPGEAWVFVAHALVGGVLLAAVVAKLRRSVPRAVRAGRRGRLALGGLVTVLTLASVLGGFVAVGSGSLIVLGPWTLVSWHVVAGIALAVVLVPHLLPRRWRLLRPRLRAPGRAPSISRRGFLAGAGFAAAGAALWLSANALDAAMGGVRRFTGSRWLPPGVPPATTFFGEGAPPVDLVTWRLRVRGAVGTSRDYDLAALRALGIEVRRAVLDCTSGWAMDAEWAGVSLASVLDAAGPPPDAARVVVRSATGWAASLGLDEARGCLLATDVAGAPLPLGNGWPLRLVVPGRRGLDWVKWVTEVEVLPGG